MSETKMLPSFLAKHKELYLKISLSEQRDELSFAQSGEIWSLGIRGCPKIEMFREWPAFRTQSVECVLLTDFQDCRYPNEASLTMGHSMKHLQ